MFGAGIFFFLLLSPRALFFGFAALDGDDASPIPAADGDAAAEDIEVGGGAGGGIMGGAPIFFF